MPERNTSTTDDFRRAIERMERSAMQRENERERALRRYENAYRTPPQPIMTNWGSPAEPTATITFPEPTTTWRMGPTVNPFSPDWIGSPFTGRFSGRPEYSEPLPNYQIVPNYHSEDPLNQRSRIVIEGIGTFVVSTEELINSSIEDLVRRLVKMGPKKAIHIVMIGVISV